MTTYEFYTDIYRGRKLTAKTFPYAVARAAAYVAKLERQFSVRCPSPESRDMAVCALAELMDEQLPAGISASSVGDVSVRYFENGQRYQSRQLWQTAGRYLDIRRGVD